VVEQTVFGSEVTGVLWVFRVKGSDNLSFDARKLHGVPSVVKEGFPEDWYPFRDDFLLDDDRVRANLLFIHILSTIQHYDKKPPATSSWFLVYLRIIR
jgi:hypothetical protein